ncbi:MAG: formyltransferase family protein [Pseudomonadota bacterium]
MIEESVNPQSAIRNPQFLLGWFSTGRDEAARALLLAAHRNMESGLIPAGIEYLFCNRAPGENPETDRFLSLVRELGIEAVTLSSRDFLPDLRKRSTQEWRSAYHQAVMDRLGPFKNDVIMLAGYMLIVSPEMCRRYGIINLHPAAPGGPAGTWQEVIWQLIEKKAAETGIMMHVVTEILDEGPPITYCTFPIRGRGFDELWDELEEKLNTRSLQQIMAEEGASNKLFQKIREEGVRRELPLIVMTLKTLAEKRPRIRELKASEAVCLATDLRE